MKRKGRGTLLDVAVRLAEILPEPNALIGALAVGAHGHVRASDDIDFVSTAKPKEIQAFLRRAGIESEIRRGDVLEGDVASVVHGQLEGLSFDVLSPPVPIDWNRVVQLPLAERSRLRVVDLETLVRLKLRAGGPQDLIDVVHLVRLHPEIEGKALGFADAYGARKRLAEWLSDPRIRATAVKGSKPQRPSTRKAKGSRSPRRRGGKPSPGPARDGR